MEPEQKPETVLVLRTCAADGSSYGGFKWPLAEGAEVVAPDWTEEARCGGGLHGLLDGEGDWSLLDWGTEAKALIVETEKARVVDIGLKVKFPRGVVKRVTNLATAICALLCDPENIKRWVAERVKAGDASQLAASGYDSKLAASGHASKLAASGYDSKLAASGDASKLAASGYDSKLAASGRASKLAASGDASKLAASGYDSKLAASGHASQLAASGYDSKLAASGDASQLAASGHASQLAASGDDSKLAASGYDSKLAASGDDSVVIAAGLRSTVSVGERGAIALTWHDGSRYRIAVAYVRENGIEPNVEYKLNDRGEFVRAD